MKNDILRNLFEKTSIWFYLLAIIFSLLIRFLLCIFKALAHWRGETGLPQNERKRFWILFKKSFFSNSGKHEVDDYFLPLLIGIFELIILPLLLEKNALNIIAVWLGFKAIGAWNTKNERTAYNRFLFGNILVIIFSYLLWKIFF